MSVQQSERDPFDILAESFQAEYRAGKRPSLDDYARRHPEWAQKIYELFPVLIWMEQQAPAAPGSVAWAALPTLLLPVAGPACDGPAVRRDSDQMPAPSAVPPRYRLIGEIARGGMGVVLYGHDKDLGRDLAFKVLLDEHAGRPESLRRFVEEAQIGGQLQHPGIVPVYELGRFGDQRPYFTMKLVQGRTLAALLGERTGLDQDRPRFLGIFQQVAQTLAYAHARGVIHRDLKPANVMVGAFGEVQVMDWGLAKVLKQGGAGAPAADSDETAVNLIRTVRSGAPEAESQPGEVLGTLAYMPPEQATGAVDRLDRRADVFGLGAVLCEILTGYPPYTGPSREEVCRKAAHGDQAGMQGRLEKCGAEAELVALARGCLAPEASDRPADAQAVADGITGYLDGVQERLRRTELERAEAQARAAAEGEARVEAQARARAERRARRLTAGLAAAVLTLVLLGGGGWVWLERGQAARRQATSQALGKAEQLAQQAREVPRRRLEDFRLAAALWEQALDAVGQADKLAAVGPADAELLQRRADLRQNLEAEAGEARERLKQANGEANLLADLEQAQLAGAAWVEGKLDRPATLRHYEEALRTYGLDVRAGGVADLADRLRRLPPSLLIEVVFALEYWARWTEDDALRRRLQQAVQEADGDEWRRSWRAARANEGVELLRQLAEEAHRQPVPALGLRLLSLALQDRGAGEEAINLLRHGQGVYPTDFWIHFELGNLLYRSRDRDKARLGEAIGCFHAALALRPQSGAVHNNLGNALYDGKDLAGAIEEYRRAIDREEKNARAHCNLGNALRDSKDLPGAIEEYRRALDIDPTFTKARTNLSGAYYTRGFVLHEAKDLSGAIAAYKRATVVNPTFKEAYLMLGFALLDRRDLPEAIDAYKQAIKLDRNYAKAHYNLGNALVLSEKLEDAVIEYDRAIEIDDPNLIRADAYCQRGLVLRRQGRFVAALESLRRGHEIGSQRPDWSYNSAMWAAACAVALAAAGQGDDATRLDDGERVGLRSQAYEWLRADLKAWTKRVEHPEGRLRVREILQLWEKDPDLATVRKTEALAKLPEDERGQWQQLWADVADLLERANR